MRVLFATAATRLVPLALLAIPLGASAAPCAGFSDVDTSDGYCAAVEFIKNKGVTTGCTDTTYCPDIFVTRAQMALYLQRFARGGPNNELPDATSAIGGGDQNIVEMANAHATIGGGEENVVDEFWSTVGGGHHNRAIGGNSTVGGGTQNTAEGSASTVAGGVSNVTPSVSATIGGGATNNVWGAFGTVSGGEWNTVGSAAEWADHATVAGGERNAAFGVESMVAGGSNNRAVGDYSFAAGHRAIASEHGAFVWADDGSEAFFDPATTTHGWGSGHAANTFNARAIGGVWFVSGVDVSGNPNAGVRLNPGSGTWASTSDRAAKENFRPIDAQDILSRVAVLPVESWNYIAEGAKVRHIGPVAQDFHAAFAVGPDDRSITSIDEGGVALVAIKGLNDKLEREKAALEASNTELRRHNDELEHRLEALEHAIGR